MSALRVTTGRRAAPIPETLPRLTERLVRRVMPRMIGANVAGGAVVFLASTLAAPAVAATPQRQLVVGAVVAVYLVAVAAVGVRQARRTLDRDLRPLYEDRRATPAELRVMLTISARRAAWVGIYWVGAALVVSVTLLLLGEPPGLAARGGVISLLGGLVTATLCFLVAEQVTRPLQVAALRGAELDCDAAPGIGVRILVTWVVGSGIPLLAIALAMSGAAELDRGRLAALGLVLALCGLVVGGGMLVSTAAAIAHPLGDLRRAMDRVRTGSLDAAVDVSDAGEVGHLQAGFNRMVHGLREREMLRDVFGRHVGPEVARLALERTDLGGEAREAAVLFVDAVGSTTLAERLPPADVVAMLNAMFDAVVQVTAGEGGLVNKFEGDAALCVFGAPVDQPDHAARACRAARRLQAALLRVAERYPHLRAAVGVSCGRVVAGNVGARQRYEYTVIGDAVNEAARLTEAAKSRPGLVLASGTVVAAAGDEAGSWVEAGETRLRGRAAPTRLFVPRG